MTLILLQSQPWHWTHLDSVLSKVPPGHTWSQVDAGTVSTCGVNSTGTILCWGKQGPMVRWILMDSDGFWWRETLLLWIALRALRLCSALCILWQLLQLLHHLLRQLWFHRLWPKSSALLGQCGCHMAGAAALFFDKQTKLHESWYLRSQHCYAAVNSRHNICNII